MERRRTRVEATGVESCSAFLNSPVLLSLPIMALYLLYAIHTEVLAAQSDTVPPRGVRFVTSSPSSEGRIRSDLANVQLPLRQSYGGISRIEKIYPRRAVRRSLWLIVLSQLPLCSLDASWSAPYSTRVPCRIHQPDPIYGHGPIPPASLPGTASDSYLHRAKSSRSHASLSGS